MIKRTTIKDVAREANVSVATVSYVINNKQDQKISDETRKRILHIINLLDYQINPVARSLATGVAKNIAVVFDEINSPFCHEEKSLFLDSFSSLLNEKNFRLTLLPNCYTNKIDNTYAIVSIGFSKENFYKLGDNNFVPIIAVDSLINDPLFFQVNLDYQKIRDKNILMVDTNNDELKTHIKSIAKNATFVKTQNEVMSYIKEHNESDVVTIGKSLYSFCRNFLSEVSFLEIPETNKINVIFDCVTCSVNRDAKKSHDVKI